MRRGGLLARPVAALIAASLLFLVGCAPAAPVNSSLPAARPSREAPASARWTVLIYLDANNDLEAAEMDNLLQMAHVGSTAEVNLVVLCARSPRSDADEGYSDAGVANLPDWSTCKLLRVEKERLVELADWGHVNMADGRTVERFLDQGVARFPAQRYALILSDHGMGWPGCCGDETVGEGDDILALADLEKALRRHATRHGRLDLVGFDACLMASLEVARAVAPHARTMVASEELAPETGWSYETTLRKLVQTPGMDAAALGRHLADDFLASFDTDEDSRAEGLGATLSVIDLDRVEALSQAVDELARNCSSRLGLDGRKAWLRLAVARSRTEQYGRSEEEGEDSSELFDLQSFAEEVMRQWPGSEASAAARQVLSAHRAAVLHTVHGEGRPRAHGLSVFLPKKRAVLDEEQPVRYRQALGSRAGPWVKFLEALADITGRQKARPSLAPMVSSGGVLGKGGTVTLTSRCVPDEVEEASFVLARPEGKTTTIVGQVPASTDPRGQLSQTWDGAWFDLGDGTTDLVCPLSSLEAVPEQPGAYLAQVPAELRRAGGKEWRDVTLHLLVRFRKGGGTGGRFMYAFADSKYGPRQITLRKGDRLRPVYRVLEEDGTEGLEVSDDREDQLQIARTNGVKVGYGPLDPGTYSVGFVVRDHADHTADELVRVRVR